MIWKIVDSKGCYIYMSTNMPSICLVIKAMPRHSGSLHETYCKNLVKQHLTSNTTIVLHPRNGYRLRVHKVLEEGNHTIFRKNLECNLINIRSKLHRIKTPLMAGFKGLASIWNTISSVDSNAFTSIYLQ